MSILRPNRRKDRNKDAEALAYAAWVHSLPCLVCRFLKQRQATPGEAAHIGGNMAAKANNWRCLPLCRWHHREAPDCEERLKKAFWDRFGLDREALILEYNERFRKEQQAA